MAEKHPQRIVVKVGTSTITNEQGDIDIRAIELIVRQIAGIEAKGYQVILVSSGAIAVGAKRMQMREKPESVRDKQAAAAVGQCGLMHLYDKLFAEYGRLVAQILLDNRDVEDKERRHNLQNTFDALLERGVIPIVNENDSVSLAEIESEKKRFSDNDMLGAIVAAFVGAEELFLLTDTKGLYDKDPAHHADARLIEEVREIDETIMSLAEGSSSGRGRGGMITKLEAAEYAVRRGIRVHLAYGREEDVLYRLTSGKPCGTCFPAEAEKT
ncbi:MAG: glutamate 5-kinase [Lachnospiraceae bacterium]|nr:glutamate 5-kinase [Lachnospiraceae bacterium]